MTFEEAAIASKTLTKKPSNDVLLKLYALYKQGTEGDVKGERPGGFDFKGAAKFDTWSKYKGVSEQDAKQQYTELVAGLLESHK